MNQQPWKPTYVWHAVFFGALLALCAGVYGVLTYLTARAPEPYQKFVPAAEATPWLHPKG